MSALLVCSFAVAAIAPTAAVLADDYDQKIQQKDQAISGIKSKEADVESQITSLQNEVATLNEKAQTLLSEQGKLRETSQQLEEEIAQLSKRIEKRQVAIQNQARDVQVKGTKANYMDAVLNAESISDAITRIQATATIMNANNDLVKQQQIDKKDVETKKADNEVKIQEIQENQVALEQQKGQLEKSTLDLEILQTGLAAERATAEGQKSELVQQKQNAEAERARIAEQERVTAERAKEATEQAATQATEQAATQATEQAATQAPAPQNQGNGNANPEVPNNNVPTPQPGQPAPAPAPTPAPTPQPEVPEPTPQPEQPAPPSSGNAGAVLAEAAKHLGKPYVWGAKGPDSFDCSGFTSYVFRNAAGREIGGYTVPQESAGARISVAQAQPGDLYFWGSPGGTYHVAIATGGGGYIHAPAPGQNVSYGSVQYFTPSFAVRM
nr:C40 family peptidase [Enterococcus rivorum]